MPSIIHAPAPLQPTQRGLKYVQSDEFKSICNRIAASVVVAEKPYEEIENRLRLITVEALIPHRESRTPYEAADFLRAHWEVIDRSWRSAIEPFMRRVDDDPVGAVAAVLGIRLPSNPLSEVVRVIEKDPPGSVPTELKEGEHYAA